MRSFRRRLVLAVGALVVFACYTVHMDEQQVKTIASQDMDCDETFIHLQTDDSNDKTVARYTVHGCERTRQYECTTDPNGKVSCHTPQRDPVDPDKTSDHRVAEAVGTAAVGCACASLFAHKSDPSTPSNESTNPNSSTPQRSR
jgi:hypothetical protein